MATCVNFGNGGFGPNHNCALPGMSMKTAKKPNMPKQNAQNFFSNGQSAMPPAACTVAPRSGFAPDAVEFAIVDVPLFWWCWFAAAAAISAVALSATSLSLVDIIIIDGAESTFFFAIITFTDREEEEEEDLLAVPTRERASADDVDVKANIIIPLVLCVRVFLFLGEFQNDYERVFVTTKHTPFELD